MIPQQLCNHGLKHIISLTLLSLILAFGAGCSSNPDKEQKPVRSEQSYYTRAQTALKAENYYLAIEHLQNLETHYPFGKYTAQAQLDLIYAHFKSGSYESAGSTAARFIQQNPNHPSLDYAYYMSALSLYDIDRGFLSRVLPTTPAQRSMKPVMDSYQALKKLVLLYPESEYTPDAQQRMIYLRNILAEHEIEVGRYYLQRGAHLASVNRGYYVLEHFPEAPSVPDALALLTKGFIELEKSDLAQQYEQTLASTYPQYPELRDGKLRYVRQSLRSQQSWLNIITFGLLGSSGQ